VLITLDTRFEFWEGLDHADSPIHQEIFELNRNGDWAEATSRHRGLVEEWIQDDLKTLQQARAGKHENNIGAAALNLYLDAESSGQVARYRKMVKALLKEIGWDQFIEIIDKANHRKCRLIDVTDPARNDSEADLLQTACRKAKTPQITLIKWIEKSLKNP
jgi:hypothetical protein